MKPSIYLIIYGLLLTMTLIACNESEAPISDEAHSEVLDIEEEPVREYIVSIDPLPSSFVCFYTADPWDDDEASRLMVFDTNGESLREMSCVNSAQFSWISEVDWKPDATEIAVLAGRGGSTNLFTISVAEDEYNRITQDDYGKDDIAWSPNGQYIAYTQIDTPDLFTTEKEIVIVDVVTEETFQITHTDGHASQPVWTADSQTILYCGSGYQISAVAIDGSASQYSTEQAELLFRSRENRYPNLDYNALADYWDSQVEIEIDTPHWEHSTTFLTFRPHFFSPATYTPDGKNVILRTDVGGAYYFGLVDPETFSCRILEPKSTGYPYQSSTEKLYWLNENEFLFFGNRLGIEGFAILNTITGQHRWLVNNENAEFDFKCWDGVSLLNSQNHQLSIDEICEQGLVISPEADETVVLELLGDPILREAVPVDPPYRPNPEHQDSLISLVYDGVAVELWKHCNAAPISTTLFAVEISSDEYSNEYGVRMNISPNQIHEVFGVNHSALQYQEGDLVFRRYSYSGNESSNPSVRFQFENGGLTGMQWINDYI